MRKKSSTTRKSITGMMITFHVYKNREKVGIAFAIWYEGRFGKPTLISDNGGELESDWYEMIPTEQQLVVVNETIQ